MVKDVATATAPASIGNVAVGYDILGLSIGVAHDTITAKRLKGSDIVLGSVSGLLDKLPAAVGDNTALRAAASVLKCAGADFGVELDVEKGIPMSSGMGGSAASAVAAVVAVNALLPEPLSPDQMLACALEGETASSEAPPLDNVSASLIGGLVLIYRHKPPRAIRLPMPPGLHCVLVHPDFKVETRAARQILKPTVALKNVVSHSANVAGFIQACHTGDLELLATCMRDVLIEPQRASLVPFFLDAKSAALEAGALSCSLSGSGPSIFAWARKENAGQVSQALTSVLDRAGVRGEDYSVPLREEAARILERD